MNKVFFGIGTNLGDREKNLRDSIVKIEKHIGRVLSSSLVYETAPWGFDTEDDFLNMVTEVETSLTPGEVMKQILLIESMLGRERDQDRYSSRVIDIDILLYDDLVIDQKGLKVPHRLMHERRFVLVPFCEIAPDTIHPVLEKSMSVLLGECRDRSRVHPPTPPRGGFLK
jgi:2-amino-4-hydroxy-6-hydroxymethyldihydropteridine diphosphokinase